MNLKKNTKQKKMQLRLHGNTTNTYLTMIKKTITLVRALFKITMAKKMKMEILLQILSTLFGGLKVNTTTKIVTIRKDGAVSMKVTVTELAQLIGAKVGDQVKIEMTKLEE